MAQHVRYDPDHEGLAGFLLSPEVRAMLLARAVGAAQYAQAIAPVRSGNYQESIHAEDAARGGPKHDRAAVRVVADAEYSAAVEFGNVDHKPHHTLARTIEIIEHGQ